MFSFSSISAASLYLYAYQFEAVELLFRWINRCLCPVLSAANPIRLRIVVQNKPKDESFEQNGEIYKAEWSNELRSELDVAFS